MKRELLFEDVESKVLGILGVTSDKPVIYKEEENEEPMGAAEEPGEEAEGETPEEESAEEAGGDVDIEGMSYDDKMSLVLEIIDSFEDEDEQVKFIEELQDELAGMVEEEGGEEGEEDMEEKDMEEEDEEDFE